MTNIKRLQILLKVTTFVKVKILQLIVYINAIKLIINVEQGKFHNSLDFI